MTEEKPGAAVFELADALLRCALEAAAKVGEKGAFSQGFDSDPSDAQVPLKIEEQRLTRDAARAMIGARFTSGFHGVAGFSCLENSDGNHLLRSEAFDARNGQSISFSCAIKKTLFSKYRLAAQPMLHGPADAL
jgi:hypothetical protein